MTPPINYVTFEEEPDLRKFIFIRFNPDKYNDKYDVCQNPSMEYRFGILKREIEYHMDRIKNEENQELVEINYLFYDEEVV